MEFLAFRFYGAFRWPPLQQDRGSGSSVKEHGAAEVQHGIVEVHYRRSDTTACWQGYLRWLPKPSDGDKSPTADDLNLEPWPEEEPPSAYQNQGKLRDLFGNGQKVVTLCLGSNVTPAPQPPLRFEGISVLEQWGFDSGSNPRKPRLRVPVVPRLEINKQAHYSTLQVDNANSHSLRLEAIMPLPFASNVAQGNGAWFAFTAIYPPNLVNDADIKDGVAINTLFFGLADTNKKAASLPKNPVLGTFGWAPTLRTESSNRDALIEAMDEFWPDSKHVLSRVLLDFGQEAVFPANPPVKRFTANISNNSLVRFPSLSLETESQPNGPPRFRIRQRFALKLEPGFSVKTEPTSHIRFDDGNIDLRAPDSSERWLRFGPEIYLEASLSGEVSDESVWDSNVAVTLTLTIGSEQEVVPPDNELPDYLDGAPPATLTLPEILLRSIAAMRMTLASRRQLYPGQPFSVLPELTLDGKQPAHFGLFARRTLAAKEWVKGEEVTASPPTYYASLQTADVFAQGEAAKLHVLNFIARWPAFNANAADGAPNAAIRLQASHIAPSTGGGKRFFVLRLTEMEGEEPASLLAAANGMLIEREGPLLSAPEQNDGEPSWLAIGWPVTSKGWPVAGQEQRSMLPRCGGDFHLHLDMAIDRITPVGDASVLVLADPPPAVASSAQNQSSARVLTPWRLSVDERLWSDLDREEDGWRLELQLHDRSTATGGSRSAVLFSTEPFAFVRYHALPLGERGNEGSAVVARYDSDSGRWTTTAASEFYRYVQQAQAVGESMDKPRRLELHDFPGPIPTDGFARPYPDPDQSGDTGMMQRHMVEFRLTPPANLWVRPADIDRNHLLPEWATRDIFGGAAQAAAGKTGVGAALAAFRGEFVYGLAVGLWPAAEHGPSRRARVAEIEALTGSILEGRSADASSSSSSKPGWNEIRQAFQRRPERLEFWADDPDAMLPFAPARFERGARFALRTTALHRPPVPGQDANGDVPSQRTRTSPRLHPQGLAGGALWPIESANVLRMLLDGPQAEGGHIDGIALSPLGGDADQTVRFCGGRVTITTETRNGHVQRQRVEVIGRIAVWWHRAKHVVIYERTVNPSAQFTPEAGLGTRTRRPVLRKVGEFIELLQPERHYPDAPNAPAPFNCFVHGMRFNTTVIPVDSLWGEDVDQRGWKVPLWNRHAERVRPQVYSKPDVVFLMVSEGTATDAITPQGCLNPDNLWFFTSTRPDASADTDLWDNERAVDWINLLPPRSSAVTSERGEAAVPPGFARFTWRLAPATQRTAVNATRGQRPVYAALRTITFMRAGRVDSMSDTALPAADPIASPFGPEPAEGAGPLREFEAAVAALNLPADFPSADAKDEVLNRINRLKGTVDALAQQDGKFKQALGSHLAGLRNAREEIRTTANNLLGGADLDSLLGGQGCEVWKRNIEGSILAKRLAIDQELQAWETQFHRKVDQWLQLADADELKRRLTDEVAKALQPVFAGTTASIGQFDHGIELAREALREAKAQTQSWLGHARRELEAIGHSVEHDKPWSARRLDDLKEQIDSVFVRTRQDLGAAIDEACDRLITELDDVARPAGASAVAVLRAATQVLDGASAWPAQVNKNREQVHELLDPIVSEEYRSKLRKLQTALANVPAGHAYKVLENNLLNDLWEKFVAIQTQVDAVSTVREALLAPAEQLTREAGRKITNSVVELRKALADWIAWTNQAQEHLHEPARTVLSDIKEIVEEDADDEQLKQFLASVGNKAAWIDYALAWVIDEIKTQIEKTESFIDQAVLALETAAKALSDRMGDVREQLQPDAMATKIVAGLIGFGNDLIEPLGLPFSPLDNEQARELLHEFAARWRERATAALDAPQAFLGDLLESLNGACEFFENVSTQLEDTINRGADEIVAAITSSDFYQRLKNDLEGALGDANQYAKLIGEFANFKRDMHKIGDDLARSGELVTAYADRAISAIADIGKGDALAAPSNILRAMAALGSAPELPNFECARRQLGYYYGLVDEVVDTTRVEAWFGRLGESLKAWGLNLPFDRIGDRLLPMDLSDFDIGKVFRNCGGLELQRLFKGCRLPKGTGDAIRLSHDFNRETYRAWVQLDVDARLGKRQTLVGLGPFCLNALNTRLLGRVRLEASKDSAQVEDEGEATLRTDFEIVIAGQKMVTLHDLSVHFAKGTGLIVDFDPRKIDLNPSLQFIQNTLGTIIGDELGGMTVIKHDGIPVGLEHLYATPPLSLMYGASGVQNIQISNQFQLIAFPDFRLSNRFSLARPERPFIFSIFLLGGTGWLTVDVDYRPFGDELLVVVDAAVGGSASLGFAFAGCTGSVAITLAAVLKYRKLIGSPGGGLTVSMALSIYGVVDVLRIASASLNVTLSLSYAEGGTIHARGRFSLEVRISRFFSISASGEASYQMSGGQRRSESHLQVNAQPTAEARALVSQAREKAERLLKGQES